MSSYARVALLAVLLLFAGCLGLADDGGKTTEPGTQFVPGEYTSAPDENPAATTPSSTPQSETTNSSTAEISNVSGISTETVNESALIASHTRSLQNLTSFTAVYTYTKRIGNETTQQRQILYGLNRSSNKEVWLEQQSDGRNRTYYRENGTIYSKITGEQTVYQETDDPPPFDSFRGGERLREIIETGQFDVAETQTENGTTVGLLRTTTPTSVFRTDIETYGARAVVTELGMIERAEYSYSVFETNGEAVYTYTLGYSLPNQTTIRAPAWVEQLR